MLWGTVDEKDHSGEENPPVIILCSCMFKCRTIPSSQLRSLFYFFKFRSVFGLAVSSILQFLNREAAADMNACLVLAMAQQA